MSVSPTASSSPLACQNDSDFMFGSDSNSYLVTSVLGQCCGDIGQIYLAIYLPSNTPIALKKFNLDKVKDEMENIQVRRQVCQCFLVTNQFYLNLKNISLNQNEIILTRQLRHPNVVMINAAFVMESHVCVVSPLMAYGSCRDLLNRHFTEGLPELAISYLLKDVLQALDYIHKKGYIHRWAKHHLSNLYSLKRDCLKASYITCCRAVRASHILVSENGQAVLSGLRYACRIVRNGKWQRNVHSFPPSTAPNLNWLSPELLEQVGMISDSKISVRFNICSSINISESLRICRVTMRSLTYIVLESLLVNLPTGWHHFKITLLPSCSLKKFVVLLLFSWTAQLVLSMLILVSRMSTKHKVKLVV